jgi:hypothetical protein
MSEWQQKYADLAHILKARDEEIAELKATITAVREALTIPHAGPLTLFDFKYSRYALGDEASFEREMFMHEFITGDSETAAQMRAYREKAQAVR